MEGCEPGNGSEQDEDVASCSGKDVLEAGLQRREGGCGAEVPGQEMGSGAVGDAWGVWGVGAGGRPLRGTVRGALRFEGPCLLPAGVGRSYLTKYWVVRSGKGIFMKLLKS